MRRPSAALPFLLVTVFLDMLALGLVVPIAPTLTVHLGGITAVGLLGATFGLCQWLTAPVLGALSDRYGRRPVLLASLAGLGLNYAVFAVAPSLWLLFVSQALAGATAGTYPVVNAYVADVVPAADRARAYGRVGAAFAVGFIAGPALGGLLGAVNLRLPFLVAAGLAVANVLYGYFVLPESLPLRDRRATRPRFTNPLTAVLALARRPRVRALVHSRLWSDLARQIHQTTVVLYGTYRFGWSTAQTGAVLAVTAVAGAAVSVYLVGPCTRRLGDRRAAILGLTVAATTTAGCALAPYGWLGAVFLVLSSLAGIASAATQAWLSRLAGADEQGAVNGAMGSISSLTETVVPIPAAALLAWSLTIGLPGLAYGVGAVALVVATVHLLRSDRP